MNVELLRKLREKDGCLEIADKVLRDQRDYYWGQLKFMQNHPLRNSQKDIFAQIIQGLQSEMDEIEDALKTT